MPDPPGPGERRIVCLVAFASKARRRSAMESTGHSGAARCKPRRGAHRLWPDVGHKRRRSGPRSVWGAAVAPADRCARCVSAVAACLLELDRRDVKADHPHHGFRSAAALCSGMPNAGEVPKRWLRKWSMCTQRKHTHTPKTKLKYVARNGVPAFKKQPRAQQPNDMSHEAATPLWWRLPDGFGVGVGRKGIGGLTLRPLPRARPTDSTRALATKAAGDAACAFGNLVAERRASGHTTLCARVFGSSAVSQQAPVDCRGVRPRRMHDRTRHMSHNHASPHGALAGSLEARLIDGGRRSRVLCRFPSTTPRAPLDRACRGASRALGNKGLPALRPTARAESFFARPAAHPPGRWSPRADSH